MSLKIFRLKMKMYLFLLVSICLMNVKTGIAEPAAYYNYKSLRKRIMPLAQQDPNLVRVDSIAQSIGKRKIWLVEVGKGAEESRRKRPAVLIVAGIEGNDLIGT